MFLKVLDAFQVPHIMSQIDQGITPKQTTLQTNHGAFQMAFQQEIDKMLKEGVLKPVHESTHGSTVFCLLRGRTSWAIWNLESAWTPSI